MTDPKNPKQVSRTLTNGYALGVAVKNGFAFIADEEGGILVLDVHKPFKPVHAASFKKGNVNFVLISKQNAYVADGYRGIVVYDVKNPARPKQLSLLPLPYASKPKPISVPPLGLSMYKHYLLVANGERGLDVVDIKNPSQPKHVTTMKLMGFSYSVMVHKDTAYVADLLKGIAVIDLHIPQKPKLVRFFSLPGQAADVTLWRNKLVISSVAGGLHVVDAHAPHLKILGHYTEKKTTYSVTLDQEKKLLFTAEGSGGISIYDVQAPSGAKFLSRMDTPGYARRISISGDFAYVADVIGGCHVVDIKNARATKILHTFDYQQHPWDVFVSKDFAFIADAHHGFSVFDVSRPQRARFVSNVNLGGYTVGIDVEKNIAFLADLAPSFFSKKGLFIFNISNPARPKLLSALPLQALDLLADNTLVYVAGYKKGLFIVNAKNPSKPEILSRFKTRGYVYGVAVDKTRKRAYAADYQKGVFVLDVKNIRSPRLIKNYRTKGTPYAVAFNGDFLYIADGKKGLAVLNLSSGQITYP